MTQFKSLITCSEKEESDETSAKLDFENQEIDLFGFSSEEALDSIIFKISRDPKNLHVHLQRIFFCYQHDLIDDLFAALVDFLIILEGQGSRISQRMITGAKLKLPPDEYTTLKNALSLSIDEIRLLKGNTDTVFTQGLIGINLLVKKEEQKIQHEHDPLDLARDYIAYSQLDTAMETLEAAILVDFERQELHDDLLELYKLTRSEDKFLKMYNNLTTQVKTIPPAWDELKGFFNER
ncbi:MAG: hypothetical protein GQ569_15060 [Methylococcaceae bacterium]|nr:hypothetical protein [Methylococcaceae bacterium]